MTIQTPDLLSATRPVDPQLTALLRSLRPGQRIRITQTVRVGMEQWQTTVAGAFRHVDYLCTGLSTERVPEDDIVVPVVHFIKEPHSELSSVTVDEKTKVETLA
jgi:hypothetical protein